MNGECEYCSSKTRSPAIKMCDACFKLKVAVQNNPEVAKKMWGEYYDEIVKPNPKPSGD